MKWFRQHIELLGWVAALLFPLFIDPSASNHFSFCLFSHLGISCCPGCGLGRSLAFAYRGEWHSSWQTHWLAFPTVVILIYRIVTLLLHSIINLKHSYYGSKTARDASGYSTR